MDTLFSSNERVKQLKNAPLAVRMRPSTLDDYVGQKKAVGPAPGFDPPSSTTCFPV
ncbi:MAG: hypothetical protein ACLTSX_14475 [Collinsella sp.]